MLDESKGKTLEQTKKACDEKDGCESFGFCTNDGGTYLFDKKMDKNEAVRSYKNDCTTYYRSQDGKHIINFSKFPKPFM